MKDRPKIKNDTWAADLANALLLRPVFRRPKEPKKPQENFYGGDGTIHDTGHVDVQLNKDGDVVAVWFRCRMLPFQQSTKYTADALPQQGPGSIKGIVFEE
jgi:hypothetical protein